MDCLNNNFDQTSKRGLILIKNAFFSKLCHIQLIYAFLLFLSIFVEIHRELPFISETSTEILREFVFLNKFEKGLILRIFWFFLNPFFYQTSKKGEILTKTCFSSLYDPHTAKLCFSVVLKHFWRNSQGTSLFSQKVTMSERSTEIPRNFFFLTCLKRGKSWRKFGFV